MNRAGFVTCVQLGLSCVEEIYRIGGNLDLLITLKDESSRRKSGRIYLDAFAERHDIPLIKVAHINDAEVVEAVREKNLDWLFIIGWSQIAGKEVLSAPRCGCIGMHPTLLPKGRGRASIPWAILKGLSETGVTMFRLDEGVDTGKIIGREIIPLSDDITAAELYREVNEAHIRLMAANWEAFMNGTVCLTRQDEDEATVWPGRRPEDGKISKQMTVREALTLVRAVTHPYPGAFMDREEKRFRIWSARRAERETDFRLRDGCIELVDYEVEDRSSYEQADKTDF